jgi:hypothetical protein
MKIHSMEILVENFIEKIWYSGKFFVYLTINYNLIEKNYELTANRKQV